MNKTKNMFLNHTAESHELFLFTDNRAELYGQVAACYKNLRKKIKKGIYDRDEAIKLFYYPVTEGAKEYNKMFGYKFTVNERWNAAIEMRDSFEDCEGLEGGR